MKRKLISLVAVIIALLISVTMFAGCKLVTVDTEKDLDQTVATVKISDNVPTAEITKREVAMAFLSYGEYYVSTMGYSVSDTYSLIIDSLVQSRIFLQSAYLEFGAEESGKWDAVEYLTEDEKTEALYQTIKSMNDLIDNYEETEATKGDAYSATVRAVPTDATPDDEVTLEEKKEYINKYLDKGADIGTVGSERYKAYNKLLKTLEVNGLLGEEVSYIKDSSYYADSLKSNYESKLVEKFEEKIKSDARNAVTYEKLSAEYKDMYDAKVKAYADPDAFAEALSSATAANPVIYTPYTGYVYVYNLLLGVSAEQTALLGKLDKEADGYEAERAKILSATVVKDQRASWIYSGYDFDATSKKFTGDYAFLENSIPFQGDVVELSAKTDKEDAVYSVKKTDSIALADFVRKMDNYLYGTGAFEIGTTINDDATASIKDYVGSSNVYKVVNKATATDYQDKINELLFAFSTDAGSLNTYKGYVVAPTPDIGGSEKYVVEFAKAGRAFVTEGLGGASYIIVASDYGYHVMFFSEKLSASASYPTLDAFLNASGHDKGSVASWEDYLAKIQENWKDYEESDFYLCTLLNLYADVDNVLNEKRTELYNKYNFNEQYVQRFADTYSDLVTEA